MITYECKGWSRLAEKIGSQPESMQMRRGEDFFSESTIEDLVARLMDFVKCIEKSNVIIDACGDLGRVDIETLENDDGRPATDDELKLFKDNRLDLWFCIYTFHMEKVERMNVNLKAELKNKQDFTY